MKFEDKVKLLREKKHAGKETKAFLDDVVTIAQGVAYEYVLGEVVFCGAKIDLTLRPMIPRPETEFWVLQAIAGVKQAKSSYVLRVLDIFSGSGCVGLAFLKHFDEATVDMIEYDPLLQEQIELSIRKNNIKKTRTRVLQGDTFSGASGKYTIITAVPPYVPLTMKSEVMEELHAEKPLFFFDKEDGYFYHKKVLREAKDFLTDEGTLYLEFDITQRVKIEQLAHDYGYQGMSFLKDPYGHECTIALKK